MAKKHPAKQNNGNSVSPQKKKKRSLLSSLFEPADQSETEFSFADFEQDDMEDSDLFEDGEIPDLFSETSEAPAPADTPVQQEVPSRFRRGIRSKESVSEPAPEKKERAVFVPKDSVSATAVLPAPLQARTVTVNAPAVEEVPSSLEADPTEPAQEPVPSADAAGISSVPSATAEGSIAPATAQEAPPESVPGSEGVAEEASSPAVEVPADSADVPASPQEGGSSNIARFLARNNTPARTEVRSIHEKSLPVSPAEVADGDAASQMEAADDKAPTAEAAEQESQVTDVPDDGTDIPDLLDDSEAESEEPIRLFDDEDTGSFPSQRKTHRRTIRNKDGSISFINVNETESYRSIEAAKQRQRDVEQSAREKKAAQRLKLRRRQKRQAKRFMTNMVIGGIVAVGVLIILFFMFLLTDIKVSGNEIYTSDYIIQLSGLKTGQHMLFVSLDDAKKGIESNPYLQVDSISYIFPARVRVKVTERKEVAAIIGLDYNVIIDHNGYVLSMSGGTDVSDLVQITGVSMSGFQVGERLGQNDDFSTATLISLIGALEDYGLLSSIRSIDLTTPLAITMTARSGLKIFVGQPTDLALKMGSLYKLLPRFNQASISTGMLYLSAKGGAVYSPVVNTASLSTSQVTGEYQSEGSEGQSTDYSYYVTPTPEPSMPAATPIPSSIQPGGSDGFQG